jgi:hypothetical protein
MGKIIYFVSYIGIFIIIIIVIIIINGCASFNLSIT